MTHVMITDDSNSPSKNMEIMRPCTVLEIPKMEVYGIRAYGKDGITGYTTAKQEVLHKGTAQKINIKNVKTDESKLDSLKNNAKEFSKISALIVAYPKELNVEQNHPLRFESPIGGKTIQEQLDNAAKLLGKTIRISESFKNGEFVDVSSISIGKGWQGVIKRRNLSMHRRKATGKRRHSATLGSFGDHKVRWTVPQAGQMGFNYRTEHNKRILKMGAKEDVESINMSGGFKNYGPVRSDFVVIDGSVPGPAMRLVRIRKSIRERNAAGIKEPKISYIAK